MKITDYPASIICFTLTAAVILAGCMTHRVTTIDPVTGATNTVTVVDTNNLAMDQDLLQSATAISLGFAIQKDPNIVPPLKTAKESIDGILNGTNQQTTQDVINVLKASNNPTLSREVASLLKAISGIEQRLLSKYGQSVAGQIHIALTQAIANGLGDALASQ